MMKMFEIEMAIQDLARSQGSYGRLYADLMQLKESDPDAYGRLSEDWEKEGFETTLDLILYLEEGKHCKRKFWKIPVTWESYGTVEVEGATPEEALANFKEQMDELPLPTDSYYVDGSFRLSDDNESEVLALIEEA